MPSVLQKQFQQKPARLTQSSEFVIKALHTLSESDVLKLQRYADFVALRLRGEVFHAGSQDLFQEAIARTMDDRRKQTVGVDIVTHLKGAIRSIANEYRVDAAREYAYSKIVGSDRATGSDSMDEEAEEILQRVRIRLKADKEALRVFDLLREGYTAAEIRKLLGIDAATYEAARKTIYRRIKGLYEA